MKSNKEIVPIGQAAKYLNVSTKTLRRWDASGKLRALKNPSGHRYYEREKIELFNKDLFRFAMTWVNSAVAPEVSEDYLSDTQDRFKARLKVMATTINREPNMSNLASLVTAVAGEIGNNSFDHNIGNWPDVLGIFFAYDINKRVVVLADRGVGIKTTLSRVRPGLKDDIDALDVAMTERVSGRAPEQRGNGLKFVKDVAIDNLIEISLQSGAAVAIIGKKKGSQLKISLADNSIGGVLAKIEY